MSLIPFQSQGRSSWEPAPALLLMTADWGEHWERVITGRRSYWLRKGHVLQPCLCLFVTKTVSMIKGECKKKNIPCTKSALTLVRKWTEQHSTKIFILWNTFWYSYPMTSSWLFSPFTTVSLKLLLDIVSLMVWLVRPKSRKLSFVGSFLDHQPLYSLSFWFHICFEKYLTD